MSTLVKDALAPVLQAAVAISTNTTTTGTGQRVAFMNGIPVQVEVQTGTVTDGVYAVSIESSWDLAFTSPIEVGRFESLDLGDDDETKALIVSFDGAYLRSVIVSTGTTTGGTIGPITVQEENIGHITSGPGFPTAPATGTGYPNASND